MTKNATVVRLLRQDAASGMCRGHLSTAADAIEALELEVEGLRAARMAYASEFPPNGDGEPDVGSIHQNIRALKVQVEGLHKDAALVAARERERERIAAWIEPQRNDIPACGFEFATAIRALNTEGEGYVPTA